MRKLFFVDIRYIQERCSRADDILGFGDGYLI